MKLPVPMDPTAASKPGPAAQHRPAPTPAGEPEEGFLADVLAGLAKPQKAIPPKYFYDHAGAGLFERICRTPEYYPTRTEMEILQVYGPDIASMIGEEAVFVEFGAGEGVKSDLLLHAVPFALSYVLVDIAEQQVHESAARLAATHPNVSVRGVVSDFLDAEALTTLRASVTSPLYPLIGVFTGSTIGNFSPEEAIAFLRNMRVNLGCGGFLVGVDMPKDRGRLEAAYDDAEGVTAAFNRNLLVRMQRELGAELDLDGFRHRAVFNEDASRIEMHLVSTRDQAITVGGKRFRLTRGETIHTENSYKYSVAQFDDLTREAGWRADTVWVDADNLFSVHYLSVAR